MTLSRAVIFSDDEKHELLGLLHFLHESTTDAHNTQQELDSHSRLVECERRIAGAYGLDPDKLSISFGRDRAGNWHVNATYPLTRDEEQRVRGLG